MQPDEPTEEERSEELDQDIQTPFQPADPNPSPTGNTTDPLVQPGDGTDLPTDHPATDSNIDANQLYDEGVSGATGVEDTSAQDAVAGYDPDADETSDEITDQAL